MGARPISLALFFAFLVSPSISYAYPGEPEPDIYDWRWLDMPTVPGGPFGAVQSALRTGNPARLQVKVHSDNFYPLISIDATALGGSLLTATGTFVGYGDMHHYPGHYAEFDLPPLGPEIADGAKEVPIRAVDALGNVAAATASIVVDNVPASLEITELILPDVPLEPGGTVLISGRVDGTGSAARVARISYRGIDGSGGSVPLGSASVFYETAERAINTAFASSADGTTFTELEIPYHGTTNIASTSAEQIEMTLSVYDGAGYLAPAEIRVPIAKDPRVSSVLFLPGMEASRLYMRNEFQGAERQLWEPSIWTDIPELALNPDGTSANEIYTKDIIGDLFDNTVIGGTASARLGNSVEIYDEFMQFMDSLAASTTLGMREWRAYPYDWRFDPIDVVNNGTLTMVSSGELERIYLEDVVEEMASASETGKVTLVAHSNGGLIAKALMRKLEAAGKARAVDRVIFIGTPHWGTPTDIGAMLHGDGQNLFLGLVTYAPQVRAAAAGMPDIYALLPSDEYFARVNDPVAAFADTGMAKPFHDHFPDGIRSWGDLAAFASDALGLNALVTDPDPLDVPYRLSPSLLEKAAATHDALDAWTPPSGVEAVSIAGWGQPTVYAYDYAQQIGHKFCWNIFEGFTCETKPQFIHASKMTEDGDGTVVSPSAAGGITETWHFNSKRYGDDGSKYYIHKNITAAPPVQNSVLRFLLGANINDLYMSKGKPTASRHSLTVIGARSPVDLLVTDGAGNETGFVAVEGVEGIHFKKQDIPGSAVETSGENKFVILPAGTSYSMRATAYASGPTTLFVENLDAEGLVTASTTFTDIPVATSTVVDLTVHADGTVQEARVDLNGDGTTDATAMPSGNASAALDPLDYLAYIRTVVTEMTLDEKVAKQLHIRLDSVEHVLAEQDKHEGNTTLAFRTEKKIDQAADYINKSDVNVGLADPILGMLGTLRSLIISL